MVERYLRERFLPADDFARACGIDSDELSMLIERGLAPNAAYRVDADGRMRSFVFGEVQEPGAPAGDWFNPHSGSWVARARDALATHGADAASALQARFRAGYLQAMRAAHENDGPIPGLADANDHFDEAAFDAQFPGVWTHFLQGTFGLCVATPLDEAHIVAKEATQARLTALVHNGTRREFSPAEKAAVRELTVRYESLSMPFSPAEYARSSRKRLIDDMRPYLAD